jgi:hypothetical protein
MVKDTRPSPCADNGNPGVQQSNQNHSPPAKHATTANTPISIPISAQNSKPHGSKFDRQNTQDCLDHEPLAQAGGVLVHQCTRVQDCKQRLKINTAQQPCMSHPQLMHPLRSVDTYLRGGRGARSAVEANGGTHHLCPCCLH